MAQISKITMPSGTTYDLKDQYARDQISYIIGGNAISFIGISSTVITDGGSQLPTIDEQSIELRAGQLVFYGTKEFICGPDLQWHELGDLTTLGQLAYKNTASSSYTPIGQISIPTISVETAGTTTTINNPTSETVVKTVQATAPGAAAPEYNLTYYSVANEVLSLYQLGYTTGDSITTSTVTVKTGDASYSSSQPIFTGSQETIIVS